jgi:hypothetical protein
MTTWYCRYRRSSSLLVALPLRSALSVFLAQCRPFSSVLCGIDTVTAVLGCATAENVEPLSDVNGWTDISDEEEIPRVLEKVYGPSPHGEKKIDLLLHIADPLICRIYQRDPTEARGIFESPARGDRIPAVSRCEHPMRTPDANTR